MGLLCGAAQAPVITEMNWTQTAKWAEQLPDALRPEQPEVLLCSFAEVKLEPNQKPFGAVTALITPPTVYHWQLNGEERQENSSKQKMLLEAEILPLEKAERFFSTKRSLLLTPLCITMCAMYITITGSRILTRIHRKNTFYPQAKN